MRIFVYEWVIGGGFLDRPEPPPGSLRSEGLAMLRAVTRDFAQLPGVTVSTLLDGTTPPDTFDWAVPSVACTLNDRPAKFDQLVKEADRVVLIAPEIEGVLLRLATTVDAAGGKLLSPGPDLIAIASDKHETATTLHGAGVRVPEGVVVMPKERTPLAFRYPAVLKRIDGAGSLGVSRVDSSCQVPGDVGAYRLERLVTGTPASVAVICGPRQHVPLAPCNQRITTDGTFGYLGGSLPLAPPLQARASSLALAVLQALPTARGYIGVDMVLGEEVDGSADYVIEVNPRYTTSYVGLRAATDTNLADLLLRVTQGESVEPPEFPRSVEFDTRGNVSVRSATGSISS